MHAVVLDVETTGLDPKLNGIWALSALFVQDGEIVERFSGKCRPFRTDVVDSKALEVGGVTREQLATFGSPEELKAAFERVLVAQSGPPDKQVRQFLMAYNSPFDSQFLREWWIKCGDRSFNARFWTPDICIMRLAALALAPERHTMPNFRLATVAAKMGLDVDADSAHRASYDVGMAWEVYLGAMERLTGR